MTALDLLRALLAGAPASAASGHIALPANELRFTLEYAQPPDLPTEQARLSALLATDAFQLQTFGSEELDQFLVLRFPAVERTLPPRDLFSIAYALGEALDLTSAEPDLGTPFFGDPHAQAPLQETESAQVVGPLCWVTTPPPVAHDWALRTARVIEAWRHSRGEGILIGQPDSGVAQHDELDATMLRLDLAWDVLDGDDDPTDPLNPRAANPGHGTGTASVAASREAGAITGAAPAAELVPIRCLDDVKIFNTAPVTAAVLHAVTVGCHVVTMSLGGVPGRALHRAIQAAIARDMIIVAAAGNCVGIVVWPARYPEVIAVAGTNITDAPWKGSSHGATIDIAAPAELVWRAERNRQADPLSGVAPGQGTSFATALVAGVAALWLGTHGRPAVIAEARLRGTSVQALFRAALAATARVPAGWDKTAYGPGIVDAAALIALPLAAIPQFEAGVAAPRPDIEHFLDEEFAPAPGDSGFDWPRYQAEIATLALAQASLGVAPASLEANAKWSTTRPSLMFSAAARAARDPRLHRFAESEGAAIGRPIMLEGSPPAVPRLVLRAVAGAGVGLEGIRRVASTNEASRRHYLDRLETLLGESDAQPALDRHILEGADEAIDRLKSRGGWNDKARMGLEALIRLTDRPALRVRGGRIDVDDPRSADWRDRFIQMLGTGTIESHLGRIGRIDSDFAHVGTGFVVGNGLILTNRHVLQTFAAPVPRRNGPDRWVLTSDAVTIDFADQPSSRTASSRFRITGVAGAGRDDIDFDSIDLADVDAALLIVETSNAAGTDLPPGVSLDADETSVDRGQTMLVVGYPAQPAALPTRIDGSIDTDVTARLNAIFAADYGTKYAAPGDVSAALGSHSADTARRVFGHDATTLVGNSGSAIIKALAPQDIVGLHFGGRWLKENYAHSLAALRSQGNGLLDDPSVRWTNVR